jgi:hypothetical protein
MNIDS